MNSEETSITQLKLLDWDRDEEIVEITDEEAEMLRKKSHALLVDAVSLKAYHIHIRPTEHGTKIEFREGEIVIKTEMLESKFHKQLTSRLKLMAFIDIAECRIPHSGHINARVENREVAFLVYTFPVNFASRQCEQVVVEVIDTREFSVPLTKRIGNYSVREQLIQTIKSMRGLIVVCGENERIRNQVIHSIVHEIANETIVTLMIEKHLREQIPFVSHSIIRYAAGFNYEKALQYAIFQNTNVVVIDELLNEAVARKAYELTKQGVLVIVGMKAQNYSDAIIRLSDLKYPTLTSSALLGVLYAEDSQEWQIFKQ